MFLLLKASASCKDLEMVPFRIMARYDWFLYKSSYKNRTIRYSPSVIKQTTTGQYYKPGKTPDTAVPEFQPSTVSKGGKETILAVGWK
jgi:hypothetical protein